MVNKCLVYKVDWLLKSSSAKARAMDTNKDDVKQGGGALKGGNHPFKLRSEDSLLRFMKVPEEKKIVAGLSSTSAANPSLETMHGS